MLTIINIIKVLLIFGFFVYVLSRKDKDYLLKAAFLFTLVSDVVLAIAASSSDGTNLLPLGTLVFCFAQLAYFCRHCPHRTLIKIYLPLSLLALATIFVTSTFIFNFEYAIVLYAFIYAITEIFNLIFTFKQDRRTALGFALFITCDLCIAIGFIGIVPAAITDWLCWVFYLPAQILLAISPKPVLK